MTQLLFVASKRKGRCQWLSEEQFADRFLVSAHVACWLREVTPTDLEAKNFVTAQKVLGVLAVRPGKQYEGPLTAWTSEESAGWAVWGHPSDAYSVVVEDAVTFVEPPEVTNASFARGNLEVHLFPVTAASTQALQQHRVRATDARETTLLDFVVEHLGSWFTTPPLCVRLPAPVAVLAVCGQLRHVMLLGRWPCKQRLFLTYPSAHFFRRAAGGNRPPVAETLRLEESSSSVAAKLRTIASFLRSLAPHFAAHPPEGLTSHMMEETLTTRVVTLDRLAVSLMPDSGIDAPHQLKFSALALMRWLQAASLLRNRARLHTVAKTAIENVVPLVCQETARQQLDAPHGVPSREHVRRARFIFDASLSLCARTSVLTNAAHLFVGADSSPQGNANWLLVQLQILRCSTSDDIHNFWHAYCKLSHGLSCLAQSPSTHVSRLLHSGGGGQPGRLQTSSP